LECYAGIDDGFFRKEWSKTVAVLAVHCTSSSLLCPCAVYTSEFTVDGLDATNVIAELAERAARDYPLKTILLDTVVFAGFNIADIDGIYERVGVPVIAVFWYEPRREAVERALKLHFPDWRLRLSLLEKAWTTMSRIPCPRGSLLASWRGLSASEAANLLCSLQLYTRQPEPLYTAHMIASTLSRAWAASAARKVR